MKTSVVARTAAAVLLASASGLAIASEAAVEGQGDLGGANALFALLGGVAGLGIVIWVMLKVMNREKK